MRKLVLPTLAALLAAALTAGFALGGQSNGVEGNTDDSGAYAIGLWGDLPYNDVQRDVGVPNLIADMNGQKLEFTAHDGDLKAGGTPCTNAVYTKALEYFGLLEAPAVFTPGDNDWTDCDRGSVPAENNPLERLDHERQLFFSTPFTLGMHKLHQDVQSTPLCLGAAGSVPCVENRRWTVRRVTYVTLNIQGSCNNLCDVGPNPDEYAARNAADIAWLQETFAQAKQRDSVAVMVIAQADPGFDKTDGTRGPLRDPQTLAQTDGQPDGYKAFLTALRNETIAYGKPVVYVHGDSHYFRVDKPFLDSAGKRLENFTRVETFGDNAPTGTNDVQWVKVLVSPESREVFAFQPQIVPANRVVHAP
jgi:hypothetical protein